MFRGQLFVLLALVFLSSCKEKPKQFNDSAWIDLTHTFDSTTLYWPNNQSGFIHKTEAKGKTPGGYFYSSYSVCAPEHGGTHLDAPIHFAENKQTVDQIPLEKLTGNAVLVDVSEKSLKNPDYLISIQDLEFWEEKNGEIEANSIVLFRTGYGKFYPNRAIRLHQGKATVDEVKTTSGKVYSLLSMPYFLLASLEDYIENWRNEDGNSWKLIS